MTDHEPDWQNMPYAVSLTMGQKRQIDNALHHSDVTTPEIASLITRSSNPYFQVLKYDDHTGKQIMDYLSKSCKYESLASGREKSPCKIQIQ